ncbi:hypothetical protein AB0F52_25640 [Amycolatopsis sp. NPDC024027]|uniref:hypothetical protein n=1 Tax=Amycolatopsis sp. NPDC024027 TaxID=3154327 RepID=UPI00340628E1
MIGVSRCAGIGFAVAAEPRRRLVAADFADPQAAGLDLCWAVNARASVLLALSGALVDRGITVNTINPGPVDTWWADPGLAERVGRAPPAGRWGRPADVAERQRVVRSQITTGGASG